MHKMREKQQGMTLIGVVILVAVLGFYAFGIIQLVPVYLENMKVVQVMNQVKSDLDGQNATIRDIKRALEKRVDVEDLRTFDWKENFIITRSSEGYSITTDYERQKVFFANVSLLAEFTHEVQITR